MDHQFGGHPHQQENERDSENLPKYRMRPLTRRPTTKIFMSSSSARNVGPTRPPMYRALEKKGDSTPSINRVDKAVRFEFRARHDWLAGHPNDIRVTGRKNFIGILTLYSFFDRSNIERSGGSSGGVFARPIIR